MIHFSWHWLYLWLSEVFFESNFHLKLCKFSDKTLSGTVFMTHTNQIFLYKLLENKSSNDLSRSFKNMQRCKSKHMNIERKQNWILYFSSSFFLENFSIQCVIYKSSHQISQKFSPSVIFVKTWKWVKLLKPLVELSVLGQLVSHFLKQTKLNGFYN